MTVADLEEREGRTFNVPLLVAMRPRQWAKNVLVVAAPLAAEHLTYTAVWSSITAAFFAFCLASSAVYLINDSVDAPADRLHPKKCHRPIASGDVSPLAARATAVGLVLASLVVAATSGQALVILVGCYLVLQAGYIFGLKDQAVLDICVVASGFLIRAIAGGVAADIRISQWFLLVAGFGSLFIVSGKRYSELRIMGAYSQVRRTLTAYTDTYLRFVWGISAGATIMAYSLWALEQSTPAGVPWHTVSIGPFVVAMLRYAVDVDAGKAEEPEEIVWRDRVLQLIGLAWLMIVLVGIARG